MAKLLTQNFIRDLKDKLNLKTINDWQSLSYKKIQSQPNGSYFLRKYSLNEIKRLGCPENKDLFSKSRKPANYWENKENIQLFINELKETLNLNSSNDWKFVTKKQIELNNGSSLLKKISLYQLKCLACPESKELFSKARKPSKFWENKENVQVFLHILREKLNLNTIDDWNSISKKKIIEFGGYGLLSLYSILDIKCMGCPDGANIFSQSKDYYYENEKKLDDFLNKLKLDFNLIHPNDWNSLTYKQIESRDGGNILLRKYSLSEIKSIGCPEGKYLFQHESIKKPQRYWENRVNVQIFLDKLKKDLNLQTIEDWNKISKKQIIEFGGRGLFSHFCLSEIKSMGCPEGKYIFQHESIRKPPQYWDKKENIQIFLKKLQQKLDLITHEDWIRLSMKQISEFGGYGLLKKYSKEEIIRNYIPGFSNGAIVNTRSSQRWLFLQVQKLFPNDEIVEDYFHSNMSRKTGSTVQFDVFLAKKNIAFEYHGKQHYEDTPSFPPIELYKYRDNEKNNICKEFGLTLIIIPYWWNNKLDTLKDIIESQSELKFQ